METPPPGTASPREAHLRDYWRIVWQARFTVAAIAIVVLGLTAVWTFLQPKIYRATATVEVQPQAARIAAGRDVSGLGVAGYGWFAEEKYHNTQVEIIRSRRIASKVFDELQLQDHPLFVDLGRDAAIDVLRARVSAMPRRETGLIEISISGTNPSEITHWVNAVADAYATDNYDRAAAKVDEAVGTIEKQLTDLQQQVTEAENARFQELRTAQISSDDEDEIIKEKLKTYNKELTERQIEVSGLRESLRRIDEVQRGAGDPFSVPELATDENLTYLVGERLKLERAFESAKVGLRPGHQDYQKFESELQKVRTRINGRVSEIIGTLQNRYSQQSKLVQDLQAQIGVAESESVRLAENRSSYDLKKTEAETKKTVFDMIAKTVSEVRIGQELMSNNVSILDEAVVPRYPIRPRKQANLLIGTVVGLFLGVGAAFFLDYLDNTFRTPDDIEKYLDLSVLGVIPRMQETGLTSRAVKEAYQSLRTSVIFCSKNHRRKVIVITSSGPQEGKSSTVFHLGQMLAAAGDRVIIVDCDLRRPMQHAMHKVDRESGVTNYLAAPLDGPLHDAAGWRTFVKSVGPQNLHVLPSGPIPPSPPELLSSERFATLVGSLRESYDWVLIDSPPAASLSDATLLAAVSDMLILVVRHAVTDRELVQKTLQRLAPVSPAIAGVVLNSVDLERAYRKDHYYAAAYYYTEDGDERSGRSRRETTKAQVG